MASGGTRSPSRRRRWSCSVAAEEAARFLSETVTIALAGVDVGDLHNIRSLECGREAFELGEQGTEGEGEDDDASGWGDGEGNRTRPSKAPARPEAKPVVFDLLSVIPTPRTELQAPNPVYESKAGFLPPSGLRGPPCRSGWVLPPDAKGPGPVLLLQPLTARAPFRLTGGSPR